MCAHQHLQIERRHCAVDGIINHHLHDNHPRILATGSIADIFQNGDTFVIAKPVQDGTEEINVARPAWWQFAEYIALDKADA